MFHFTQATSGFNFDQRSDCSQASFATMMLSKKRLRHDLESHYRCGLWIHCLLEIQCLIPLIQEASGIALPDPHWLVAINAVSLACALVGNASLLLNMVSISRSSRRPSLQVQRQTYGDAMAAIRDTCLPPSRLSALNSRLLNP